MLNNCIRCTRWKLFSDKSCTTHPDFCTTEEVRMQRAQEAIDVLMFVSAIRTATILGRFDLVENALGNLRKRKPEFQHKVLDELERLGPLTGEDLAASLLTYLEFKSRTTGGDRL